MELQWVRTISTHAIAVQNPSHRLNGSLTSLFEGLSPLELPRGKYYSKIVGQFCGIKILRFGANLKRTPTTKKRGGLIATSLFCIKLKFSLLIHARKITKQVCRNFKVGAKGLVASGRGRLLASFGIFASRNRQSPPNYPTVSHLGYVFYWIFERLGFEGIGAICVANRRKGQRPFYGSPRKGLSNCRSDSGFGKKLRWRAY